MAKPTHDDDPLAQPSDAKKKKTFSMPQFPCAARLSLHQHLDHPYHQRHSGPYILPRPSSRIHPLQDASSRQQQRSTLLSVLSSPSKISRTTTQHYILTPPSYYQLSPTKEQQAFVFDSPQDAKKADFGAFAQKRRPSRRGVCNTMTILLVVAVVLFLFAGYPLTLYILQQVKHHH
ncbi:hypothetical protein BCR43DRAFT_496016 [Syncephalastrum racemosum]|uniref:Transmembrane protein n=1 Tax=Syncephalastrum racemosum TaxID=13706 RepID=A0A1X2H6U9_SYNRA|nr:hypothetical protein BCR43DRAFT_496016 [Syncephalastrum racemosum]